MNPITVLLADDDLIVRKGLRTMLQQEADIQIVGEAKNGRQAVALAAKLGPAVVVMDISMPVLNGLEATRQILRARPTIKVLILSVHCDDAYFEHAMATGATGYLVKQTDAKQLPRAIREVCEGRPFFSPSITKRHNQGRAKAMGDLSEKKVAKFTSREEEVLQLIASGKASMEIAHELHISALTVEKHRQSVMAKLNIQDTASLTRYAISANIIKCSVQITIL